ncbi:hypothetical protein [Streptomyces sp. NBC_00154]|uniref:hypothetical protein n=1 Tax=Streptomyces sp. NBC_00154 TaxID=2975670 RepID=UPI0022563A35|nr:hypothetical protein [Streptomyces sp. NBC_00154]MCX5315792.1 hypothetical protein [Streptomyces sp. NBC_00154]
MFSDQPLEPRGTEPRRVTVSAFTASKSKAIGKQRHTISRIFHRLVEERGADVSYQMVRRYVSDRMPEILAASGKAPVEAFVP